MENKEKTIDVFCPSFKFEKRTKAFNKYIYWFVSLVFMFAVDFMVFIPHLFIVSMLNIISTFMKDHLFVVTIIPAIICVALIYQAIQWVNCLMTSYKFEDGKIIKGRIRKEDKISGANLAVEAVLLRDAMNNIGDSLRVNASNAAIGLNKIIKLVKLNTDSEFVAKYFDTELYKKKVYENPKLVGATKYSLVYECDNNKKLVIPKVYEGMYKEENKTSSSFIGRILKRVAIPLLIAATISIADLVGGYSINEEYTNNIIYEKAELEQEFSHYGYTFEDLGEISCKFTKEVGNGEKTSVVSYYFDKNGNVEKVKIQLYYDYNSKNVESELRYIIDTINEDFSKNDIDDFIELVEENFDGDYKFGRLNSNNYRLTLGRSEGYIDIHGY